MTLPQFLVIFFGPAAVLAIVGLLIWFGRKKPANNGASNYR